MSAVVCPGCHRRIDLPPAELSLPGINCSACGTDFRPADHVTPGGAVPSLLGGDWPGSGPAPRWYVRLDILLLIAVGTFLGNLLTRLTLGR